jgi:hypothetical protein
MRKRVSFAIEKAGLELIYNQFGIPFYPTDGSRWFMITVFDDITDEVLASMVCEFKNSFDVHMTAVVADARAVSRKLLRTIFSTLFTQAVRVTAVVDPRNDDSIDALRRCGFQYEGFLRRGLDGDRDGLIYGMLREDCRFLPGYQGGTVKHTDIAGEPHGFTSNSSVRVAVSDGYAGG